MIVRIIIFLMLVAISGCGVRVPPVVSIPPGIPLQEICDRYHVKWQWDGVTQVVMLEYKGNKAKALVSSNIVLLGRDRIELSSPLRRVQSIIYVPEDFESKVLAPFGVITTTFPKADLTTSRVRMIVIDAGHGGKDPGAKSVNGVTEKVVNLDISLKLRDILKNAGLKVIMTRESDEFISLPHRTEIATKTNADLFVSIHANSNPSRKTQGLEVYYAKTQSKRDLEEEQRHKNERTFFRRLNTENNESLATLIEDMMYQKKVENSVRLAHVIAQQTSNAIRTPNRGARPCRFFVVRNTLTPAVLVEVGYLSNRVEEQKLKTASYRQKIAEGIAQSILDYANN